MTHYDVIFAGGGLASVLAAYRMKMMRPELRLLIVESGNQLGGNHTWSFHHTDVTPEQNRWLTPFIKYSWPGQSIRFPEYTRKLTTHYRSITSDRLHNVLSGTLKDSIILNANVEALAWDSITLDTGDQYNSRCIIDGRGLVASPHLDLAFQKFVGLELRLARPHGETIPVIMDADISQDDGYRFVYTLPFSEDTILIEDTYYADGPLLDQSKIRDKVLTYAARRGWEVAEILRTETGTLPILLGGNIDDFWSETGPDAAQIGLRACLFHPTTGYSFPNAVKTADALAILTELTTRNAATLTESLSKRLWHENSYYRMLNRFLFLAAKPERRFKIMQRFYKLNEGLIERFYGARLTATDKVRILAGRPPVSVFSALATMRENRSQISRLSNSGSCNG